MTSPILLPAVVFAVTLSIFVRAGLLRRRLEFRARVLELMSLACLRAQPLGPLLGAAEREHTGARRRAVAAMRTTLEDGGSVAGAFEAAGRRWFEAHVVEAVRAAEGTARVGDTLRALADEDGRTLEGRHQLQLALLYPALLVLMAVGLHGLVEHRLSPRVFGFQTKPGSLAGFTGFWLGAAAVGTWILSKLMRKFDVRPGSRVLGSARLLRLAGIFASAGLSVPQALRHAAKACRHRGVARGAGEVAERLEQGERNRQAWVPLGLPAAITLRLGAVRPGRVQGTLGDLAHRLLDRHARRQERLMRWMQPASIVLVAGAVLLEYAVLVEAFAHTRTAARLW